MLKFLRKSSTRSITNFFIIKKRVFNIFFSDVTFLKQATDNHLPTKIITVRLISEESWSVWNWIKTTLTHVQLLQIRDNRTNKDTILLKGSNCTLQLHTQTPHITYTNPKSYTNPKANLFCCFKFYQSYSITLILPSKPRATFLASGSRVRSKDIIYNLILVIDLAICYI